MNFTVVSENAGSENERIADDSANQQAVQTIEAISVTLYPVPVKNELHLLLLNHQDNDITVVISNIHGQSVYTQRYRSGELNRSTIDTAGLKPGVYLLHVLDNNRFSRIVKFIKQ